MRPSWRLQLPVITKRTRRLSRAINGSFALWVILRPANSVRAKIWRRRRSSRHGENWTVCASPKDFARGSAEFCGSRSGGTSWSAPTQLIYPTKRNANGTFDPGLDWPESGVGIFAVLGGSFTFQSSTWSFIGFGEGGDFSPGPTKLRKGLNTIGAYFLKADGVTFAEAEGPGQTNPVILPFSYNSQPNPSSLYGAGLPCITKIPVGMPGAGNYRLYFFDDSNGPYSYYVEFVPDSAAARGFRFVTPTAPAGISM